MNDAAKVLKEGIVFTGSAVDVIIVLHPLVSSYSAKPLIAAINENPRTSLIDLRCLDFLDRGCTDQILKDYGVSLRPEPEHKTSELATAPYAEPATRSPQR